MDNKTCTVCNIEKLINNFYNHFSESKSCNIKRGVKRYNDNKEKDQFNNKYIMKKYR